MDALELLEGERLDPYRSKYAKYILNIVKEKEHGQVINRSELIRDVQGVEYMDPEEFRLEPEWALVLIAALVYSGDLVLAIPGKKFDATELALLSSQSLYDLLNFKHIERPKDWNIPALKALYQLLDLPPGLVTEVTLGKNGPVQQLQTSIAKRVEELVLLKQDLQKGISFWGRPVLSEDEQENLLSQLDRARNFLESLQPYSTPGKLKNLKYNLSDINHQNQVLGVVTEIEALQDLIKDIGAEAAYLSTAEALLPAGHKLVEEMKTIRAGISNDISDKTKRSKPAFRRQTVQNLMSLKKKYMDVYLGLHRRARLGANEDNRKNRLLKDNRLAVLNDLSAVELMPRQHLNLFKDKLDSLESCFDLTDKELDNEPKCPHCEFKPIEENPNVSAAVALEQLDEELDKMLDDWKLTLMLNLEQPATKSNIELLKPNDRNMINDFINTSELPRQCAPDFIRILREVLSGLIKVTIKVEELRDALLKGGAPVTPIELKNRFEKYLDELTRDNDAGKVRIVLE